MSKPLSPAAGVITVIMTLVGWSSIPLFLRHFAELIDLWTSNGWRYGMSAIVWIPVLMAAAMRKQLPPGLWKAAIVPSIVNAAGQVCFTAAHYRIDPALLTFGLRTQLVFVAIGAWLMFPVEREIIRKRRYLTGAGLLIIGAATVIFLAPPHGQAPAPSAIVSAVLVDAQQSAQLQNQGTGADWGSAASHAVGVALAIASGLLFACYGLSVRKYMHGVNSVLAFAAICQYTALAMVILMFIFGNGGGSDVFAFSNKQFIYLILSALIGIAFGHMFYYMSIARLGVAVTAGVIQLQPFLVAIGSMSLFGERLSIAQWVGGCVAVSGAMLMLSVQWQAGREKSRKIEEPVAIAEGESGA